MHDTKNPTSSPRGHSPQGPATDTAATVNAFDPAYLRRLHQAGHDLPLGCAEAENAGPWKVCEIASPPVPDERFGVFRGFEDPGRGDKPAASFKYRDLAYLCAAALALNARASQLHFGGKQNEHGHPVSYFSPEPGMTVDGHLAQWDENVTGALGVLEALLGSVEALVHLLDAAGPEIVELVGRRLAGRLEAADTEAAGADR